MEVIGTGPKYQESKLRALKEEITQTVLGTTRYVPKGQCFSGRFFVSSGSAALFDSNGLGWVNFQVLRRTNASLSRKPKSTTKCPLIKEVLASASA